MKVAELMEILEDMEPDAEVCSGVNENWPHESEIVTVVLREDMAIAAQGDEPSCYAEDAGPSDVFIVEGNWLRQVSKLMWTASGR